MRYKKFCNHLDYKSQDFGEFTGKSDPQEGDWDSSKCNYICDITNIPVHGSSFQYILCSEVFEHLPEPILAIREFSRILACGGSLLITCPFNSAYHQKPYFFSSGYSRYWFEYVSRKYGFIVQECLEYGNYFTGLNSMLRRLMMAKSPVLDQAILSFANALNDNISEVRPFIHEQPESLFVLLVKK